MDNTSYAQKAARALRVKARGIMGEDALVFHLMDFVNYMDLSNEFASRGIFVTDDNREESYIKIIETGDPSLIDKLENMINLKEAINTLRAQRDEYESLVSALDAVPDQNDEETINSIIKDYLQR